MDEYTWVWMYTNWLRDQEEMYKTYKDYALFLGSFFNSEMAQAIMKQESPDFSSSDEDFDKATENMLRLNSKHKLRRRRRLKNNGE